MIPDQTINSESHTQKTKFESIKLRPPSEKGRILLSFSDPTLVENKELLEAGLDFIREYNKSRTE